MKIRGTLTDLSTGVQYPVREPRLAVLYLRPAKRFEYVWDPGDHSYEIRGSLKRADFELPILLDYVVRYAAVVIAVGDEDREHRLLLQRLLEERAIPALLVETTARWFEDCLDVPMRKVFEVARWRSIAAKRVEWSDELKALLS